MDEDVLRAESETRSLLAELGDVNGVEVRFAPRHEDLPEGAKSGGLVGQSALWVFLGTVVSTSGVVVVAALRAWVERDRHRVVRVRSGEREIRIHARMDARQELMVQRFLDGDRQGDQP